MGVTDVFMWRGHRFSLHLEPPQSHSGSKRVRMDPGQGHRALSTSAHGPCLRTLCPAQLGTSWLPLTGSWSKEGGSQVYSRHPRAVVLAEGTTRSFGDCSPLLYGADVNLDMVMAFSLSKNTDLEVVTGLWPCCYNSWTSLPSMSDLEF